MTQKHDLPLMDYDLQKDPYPFMDEKDIYLRGWPGYRTHPNKSGFGPIETQAELAHVQGVIVRQLLTGKVITRNPVYQLLLFFIGLIYSLPLIPIIDSLSRGDYWNVVFMVSLLPYLFVGILILVNLANSIFGETEGESLTGD